MPNTDVSGVAVTVVPEKKKIHAEEFITIWQKAKSFAEVIEATRLNEATAKVRACQYRAMGIPLQKFVTVNADGKLRGAPKADYKALAALAATLGPVCELKPVKHREKKAEKEILTVAPVDATDPADDAEFAAATPKDTKPMRVRNLG